ncbi:hypothetical protein D3C80_983710 [compost metagenome]
MYDARQIANWFIQRAAAEGRRFTIMQLLKLIYIAHGWYLEMTGGAPLSRNKIEAWKHGPVIPDVYRVFRQQGIDIAHADGSFPSQVDTYSANVLDYVYRNYGNINAGRLSQMTHEPGGPWDTASRQFGFFAPITNEMILPHYQAKRLQYQSRQNG